MADYILKVYDDNIKLFTSNGMLSTDFSCNLEEIYTIKYLSTKHRHKSMNEYLSITIKNAKSKYAIASYMLRMQKNYMCKYFISLAMYVANSYIIQ